MKKLCILKNLAFEGPGLFEFVLKEYNTLYEIIDLDAGERLPDVSDVSGLLVMGGPDSANDETEKMVAELQFVKQCLARSIPYLGVCLGLQIGVKVLGGSVVKSPMPEVAWNDSGNQLFHITLTESAVADPLCEGLPSSFPVFQLHGETVKLSKDMQLLGTGTDCHVQMVRIADKAYGLQAHPELDRETLDAWLEQMPELQNVDKEKIVQQYENIEQQYQETGKSLFTNWLKIGGFIA